MNSIGNFGQPSTAAPWGGLPTGQQPWGGGQQWQAAQQAPWRNSPWQTQGMPSGQSVAAPPTQGAQLPTGYLSQGTSAGLNGFNPLEPGGGFYPGLLGGQQQQQAQAPAQPAAPAQWQTRGGLGGGQVYADQASAQSAARGANYDAASQGYGYTAPERMGPGSGLLAAVDGDTRGMSSAQVLQMMYGNGMGRR